MLIRILAIVVLLSSKGNCKSVAPSTKVDHKNVGVELILEEANEKGGKLSIVWEYMHKKVHFCIIWIYSICIMHNVFILWWINQNDFYQKIFDNQKLSITDHPKCFKSDHDSLGNDLSDRPIKGVINPKECQDLCKEDPSCFYFAVNLRNDPIENNGCWLKKDVGSNPPRPRVGVIFGPKNCPSK